MTAPASYPAFSQYPAAGPQSGPTREIEYGRATGIKVSLVGTTFSAQVQISNAAPAFDQYPHLFAPTEADWTTVAILGPADPPLDVPGQIRWVRVVLLSGTLTGGSIAESHTQGDVGKSAADLRQIATGVIQGPLAGITNTATLGAVPLGPVGIPEVDRQATTQVGGARHERITIGLGRNATVRSASNIPGQRTAVNAVTGLAQLAGFGFDGVTDFVNFDIDPAIYSVPTGAATFTASGFTAPSIPWNIVLFEGTLRPGLFVRTTHAERWYAPVTAADQPNNLLTVLEWRKGTDGSVGTPANGTGALVFVNPLDKGFVGNDLLGIGPSAPTRTGALREANAYIAGGDADVVGYDLVLLGDGSNSSRAAFSARHAPGAGRWRYGSASYGGSWDTAFYSGPDPALDGSQPRPQNDFVAEHGTNAGYVSRGTTSRPHFLAYGTGGTEVFSVGATGTIYLQQAPFTRATDTADTATLVGGGGTVTDVIFNALFNEFRAFKQNLRNAGLWSRP